MFANDGFGLIVQHFKDELAEFRHGRFQMVRIAGSFGTVECFAARVTINL
jgi:hypothetical protein